MTKFLVALAVVLLGGSTVVSFQALQATKAHQGEIDALRAEMAAVRAEAPLPVVVTDDPRVVMDREIDPVSDMSSDVVNASVRDSRPDAPDPWIEELSQDEDRLERLASLVKTRMTEEPRVPVRDEVRETLEELQDEEDQARRDRRRDMMAERTREQVKGYAEKLNLYPAEEEAMTQILLDLSETRMDFFRRAREGEEDFSKIREKMQEMTATSDDELKEILTEDQFVQYDKLREEERSQQGWGNWGRRNNNNNDSNNTDSSNESGGRPGASSEGS